MGSVSQVLCAGEIALFLGNSTPPPPVKSLLCPLEPACIWSQIETPSDVISTHLLQRLATGWTVRGWNPVGGEIFRVVQIGPVADIFFASLNRHGSAPSLSRPELHFCVAIGTWICASLRRMREEHSVCTGYGEGRTWSEYRQGCWAMKTEQAVNSGVTQQAACTHTEHLLWRFLTGKAAGCHLNSIGRQVAGGVCSCRPEVLAYKWAVQVAC